MKFDLIGAPRPLNTGRGDEALNSGFAALHLPHKLDESADLSQFGPAAGNRSGRTPARIRDVSTGQDAARRLKIANVRGAPEIQVNTDIDSMSRAAFLSAFADEFKRGDAHVFFVNFTKHQTIDERHQILADSMRERAAFRRTLPKAVRKDRREVSRRMLKAKIDKREKHGKWNDEWVMHPLPTLNEPQKAMAWLTADPVGCEFLF